LSCAGAVVSRRLPRSFHRLRCEAGWLTGVGAVTSSEFAKACARSGAAEVALTAFGRAPLAGLVVSPDVCCRLLALSATNVRLLARSAASCAA